MKKLHSAPKRGLSIKKRIAIEQSARELFMSRGFRDVSMEEVASHAGVSKATLYNHFPDKLTLFRAVIEQLRTSYIVPVGDDVAASRASFRRFLQKFGVSLLDLLQGEELQSFNQMVGAYAHEMPDLVRTIYENGPLATQRRLAEAFSLAMESGIIRRSEPMLLADQFLSLVRGVAFTEMMWGIHRHVTAEEKKQHVKASIDVMLAAYGISETGK